MSILSIRLYDLVCFALLVYSGRIQAAFYIPTHPVLIQSWKVFCYWWSWATNVFCFITFWALSDLSRLKRFLLDFLKKSGKLFSEMSQTKLTLTPINHFYTLAIEIDRNRIHTYYSVFRRNTVPYQISSNLND